MVSADKVGCCHSFETDDDRAIFYLLLPLPPIHDMLPGHPSSTQETHPFGSLHSCQDAWPWETTAILPALRTFFVPGEAGEHQEEHFKQPEVQKEHIST